MHFMYPSIFGIDISGICNALGLTQGLYNTYVPIYFLSLTGLAFKNGLFIFIMRQFYRGVPDELEESSYVDGYGVFKTFIKIILPLSGAGLATVGLYTAVFFWNDWFNSLIYLKSSQFPVMLYLRNIVNGTTQLNNGGGSSAEAASLSMSIKAAVIIVSTLPIILVYPFVQRYFVKGIMIGAVKG